MIFRATKMVWGREINANNDIYMLASNKCTSIQSFVYIKTIVLTRRDRLMVLLAWQQLRLFYGKKEENVCVK